MQAVKRKLREVEGFNESLLCEYQLHDLPVKLTKRETEFFHGWQQAVYEASKDARYGTR
jgi:hypothetical protein